ncbi:MotA/TolQ/ExbB proton channel family protein [Pelagicoccus sp. SDUM812003]|uniref:MotA/TolQ/ExbB proton channel family protein n=1 Tax=Pelagicoccus sp. SDUM812003 TaxID=3041267 RepID=UPI00280CFE67|nr:MotA/TolQ/ExbB proton channel family protein [Pelagicoccus sp. SDUM812003]MDQ8204696.1 MotA/TolQ/ExbB proton channel family protein [Pelagicoccus sp. SDUM812003]
MIEFFKEDALGLWIEGGWLMGPLFILGMLIYYSVFEIYFRLQSKDYTRVGQNEWRHWIDRPQEARGDIGKILKFVLADKKTPGAVRLRFQEVRDTLIERLKRRIKFVTIIVSSAPLTGLLGTVGGMLTTFSGLSSSEGSNTVGLIAGGISEALITTETGLVLAIPALVMISSIRRKLDALELFLTKLETSTFQRLLDPKRGHA